MLHDGPRPPALSGRPLGFGLSRPAHPALRFSSCELASSTACTTLLGERKLCARVLVLSLAPSAPREGGALSVAGGSSDLRISRGVRWRWKKKVPKLSLAFLVSQSAEPTPACRRTTPLPRWPQTQSPSADPGSFFEASLLCHRPGNPDFYCPPVQEFMKLLWP